ncbi:4'-phosphopantetheinyl transferase family protein [Streptomyces cyaneofuscatus]|uniref:4'-phosphopantetheinyl transferase family protein n=1 Tax=Streptomyces cyaneofuscatus TaxID=66883 RepID=UPI00341EC59D
MNPPRAASRPPGAAGRVRDGGPAVIPPLRLPDGAAHLWLLPRPPVGGGVRGPDATVLDPRERRRAEEYRDDAARLVYVGAHVGLRLLLGAYADTDPRAVRLSRDACPCCGAPHGRPVLAHPDVPLHFSLSHGEDMALIGVAAVPIGVDIERIPSLRTARACAAALHPAERAELAASPADKRAGAFGQVWTRKEAYLKGLGTGLARPLAADYLGVDPARRPDGWQVLDVACGPRHRASAALRTTGPVRVSVRELPSECLEPDGPSPAGAALPPAAGHSASRP